MRDGGWSSVALQPFFDLRRWKCFAESRVVFFQKQWEPLGLNELSVENPEKAQKRREAIQQALNDPNRNSGQDLYGVADSAVRDPEAAALGAEIADQIEKANSLTSDVNDVQDHITDQSKEIQDTNTRIEAARARERDISNQVGQNKPKESKISPATEPGKQSATELENTTKPENKEAEPERPSIMNEYAERTKTEEGKAELDKELRENPEAKNLEILEKMADEIVSNVVGAFFRKAELRKTLSVAESETARDNIIRDASSSHGQNFLDLFRGDIVSLKKAVNVLVNAPNEAIAKEEIMKIIGHGKDLLNNLKGRGNLKDKGSDPELLIRTIGFLISNSPLGAFTP